MGSTEEGTEWIAEVEAESEGSTLRAGVETAGRSRARTSRVVAEGRSMGWKGRVELEGWSVASERQPLIPPGQELAIGNTAPGFVQTRRLEALARAASAAAM
eukprot:2726555-Rhodomonas_salina.1